MKLPVSQTALLTRIRRALAKNGEMLKKCRSARDWPNLGDYYIVDVQLNAVVATHVDLEALARKIDVIKPYETVSM